MLRMTFIPDTPHGATRVRNDGATLTREQELRSYVSSRMNALDDALRDDVTTLTTRMTPRAFFHATATLGTFRRGETLGQWRNARHADAIRDALTRATRDYADTLTPCKRNATGAFVTADGTVLYATREQREQTRRAMLLALVHARRAARGLRRATLRSAYRGTLTRDGATVATVHAGHSQLDSAIALSDTFVTRDSVTTAILARGLRESDGTLDGHGTLAVARARARR